MRLLTFPRLLLVAAFALTACDRTPHAPVISCIGDSITFGVTSAGPPPVGWHRDPQGGWPGRLGQRLDGRARVLNRGIGGSTTAIWLLDPRSGGGTTPWSLTHALWPDFPAGPPPVGATSLALGVVTVDRPDVVIVLLGANDLAEGVLQGVAVVPEVADRLNTILAQARTIAPTVLVATVLPSNRDPAPLRDALNARIRADHPDYLPFGERFAAADRLTLLGDAIHPNEAGYALLAEVADEELRRRGIVP